MKGNYSDELDLRGKGKNVCVSICHTQFVLRDFPEMMKFYLRDVVGDKKYHFSVEAHGERLRKSRVSVADVPAFVKCVCHWGGHSGIGARVINQNEERDVARAFNKAAHFVKRGKIENAIAEVEGVRQLGLSFASKHLRMLCPQQCVVYDSILWGEFWECFPHSHKGYAKFCSYLGMLAAELNSRRIRNTERPSGKWYAADVEAAVFGEVWKKQK